jgi:hypothetical protein
VSVLRNFESSVLNTTYIAKDIEDFFRILYFICFALFNTFQGETLETLTMATVCLFNAQPQLADQVPPLGHLPKVIQAMNHRNNAIPKSAIRVIHALSDNEVLMNPFNSLELWNLSVLFLLD